MAQDPIDDVITLGGQAFPVKGMVRGNAVSEFEAGIKIGAATYDSREHAFFLVLDDFSGGMNHRRLNIRTEQGTFWESLDTNAPDLRRAQHITLPPLQGNVTMASLSANSVPASGNDRCTILVGNATGGPLLTGVGPAIFTSSNGTSFTKRFEHTAGAELRAFAELNENSFITNIRRVFAFFYGQRYQRTAAGSAGGNVDITAWVNGASNFTLEDGIYWDNKIVAVNLLGGIIFAVDDGAGTATELWNINDPADGEVIYAIPGYASGFCRFIGVATAPWGDSAIYFYHLDKLYVLDFFNRTANEIELGLRGRLIKAATMWNGDIVITDGWNILQINPANQTVRNIAPFANQGIPPKLFKSGTPLRCVALSPMGEHLAGVFFASSSGYDCRLFVYNGLGWSQLGASFARYGSVVGSVTVAPLSTTPTSRRFYMMGFASASNDAVADYVSIPTFTLTPTVGTDSFGASGAQWTTGWIDGGFNDISGTLLRLNVDAFNLSATSTVTVEYQLDNAESSAWVQMVDTNNVADVFDNSTSALYFSATTPKTGIAFRTVRFRITLNRGATATDSPELRALTLVYLKVPSLRTAWTFEIDINRMITTSASGSDTTFYVDGVAATMANVWAKLRTLWDTHTLLTMIIPNVEPSPGIYVRINDMPISFDDFRNAVTGQGTVVLQVLEPVE